MELIVLIALIVGVAMVRKQHLRLKSLERDMALLRGRVEGLQPGALVPPVDETPYPVAEHAVSTDEAVAIDNEPPEPEEEQAMPGPWGQVAARAGQATAPGDVSPAQSDDVPEKRDLETALGTRWAVWVGGLALALGGVFLVRYSIEAGIFGPQVRLAAAALFGVLLAAAGEILRRKGAFLAAAGTRGAYVPAILTAAATFTLFSTTYAAHGIYGFIGPASAFAILAALALATMGLALLHGQALAGLGLLGSYLTPVLVASDAPNVWTLFAYLSVVVVAAMAVASFRRWRFLSGAALAGSGLWSVVYLTATFDAQAAPVVMVQLAGLASLAIFWLARPAEDEQRPDPASFVAAVFLYAIAAFLARGFEGMPVQSGAFAAVLLAVALGVAAWRERAVPLLHAAGLATLTIASWSIMGGSLDVDILYGRVMFDGVWVQPGPDLFLRHSLLLGALFLLGGIVVARVLAASMPLRSASWAFWAALVPLWVMTTAWVSTGDLNIDWRFAAASLALAAILSASAEMVARAEQPEHQGGWAVTFLSAGAAAALCLGLLAGFGPVLTTVLTGLAAAVPAALTRVRNWPVLGWLSAGLAAVVLARIGVDPTIAGAYFLSATPVFNALTPGYFLPAAAFAYAAWQLARTTDGKPRLLMEAFGSLFALLGAAMLVRHAMNGGVIGQGEPNLAEQSIYTLIMIGGGAILLALDRRAPSPVLRWGSIGLGVFSVLTIVFAHLIALNPLMTNESTGAIPFFNLLLLAYLLPAVAMAALAWRARGRRPEWYVTLLAAGAAALAFAYVTLSVRRIFHGEFIGAWKGMDGLETYTYSAVWLALGVIVLAAGLRFGSRALRLGSAALVVTAVAKVFLYDMRELEGVLRALSFMGLGAVLIGIGLFYQRMLVTGARRAE